MRTFENRFLSATTVVDKLFEPGQTTLLADRLTATRPTLCRPDKLVSRSRWAIKACVHPLYCIFYEGGLVVQLRRGGKSRAR